MDIYGLFYLGSQIDICFFKYFGMEMLSYELASIVRDGMWLGFCRSSRPRFCNTFDQQGWGFQCCMGLEFEGGCFLILINYDTFLLACFLKSKRFLSIWMWLWLLLFEEWNSQSSINGHFHHAEPLIWQNCKTPVKLR